MDKEHIRSLFKQFENSLEKAKQYEAHSANFYTYLVGIDAAIMENLAKALKGEIPELADFKGREPSAIDKSKIPPKDLREMTTNNDIESALKSLADGRQRIAVIYDAEKGWCVTDDMDVLAPKMGPQAPEFRVIAYKDWFCETLSEAVEMLRHVNALRCKAQSSLKESGN